MTSKWELAVAATQDLGREFLATVFGTGPTGSTSFTCGPEDVPMARFHLNFFQEGECAGVDWFVVAILTVIVHAVSWLPRYIIYEPLANARMKGFKTWDQAEVRRFSQTATSLLFFSCSGFCAWRVLSPHEWLYYRMGWKDQALSELVQPDFKFYYLLYAARFFSDVLSLFFESRKKDAFIVALIHHLTTLGLVLGSAHVHQTGYGGIIMFFFDWADIPLLSAKLCKYLSKDPNDMFQFTANRLFEVFALCFFATRNLFYNYVVIGGTYDCWDQVLHGITELLSGRKPNNEFVMLSLLMILAVLQTYWMWLIVKAVQLQKKSDGNISDVREDKKDV